MIQQVTLDDVSAGYAGRPVLAGVSARIPAAAVTAVVGPNGSGKSTLLGVLAGVLPAMTGTVRHRTGARPALVPQRSTVPDALPVTVRDTVAMGRWGSLGLFRRMSSRERSVADACMDRLGIGALAARRIGELSGGQRQRALVAQGLAQEADLLLLDEPTTGLDLAAQHGITDVLRELAAEGVTVVYVTHDPAAARRAGHCLLLRDGRLVQQGPPGAVLAGGAPGPPHCSAPYGLAW
ncbi:zinc ABC transporter ATP-binding protein AztA [Streptomyces sp. TRM 70351]|uniref:zinc ABC transporter ATP-binding protein AztA n=1 Tax=Streptomyces sp. TRM 70351 TaxID=3116552 RepID=UPI002E7C3149|nr:zinc ABC transporter ATP-binding protein AztA [Streptomyces sp. TRM 70351]MEE1927164.1 zinc ABC transporter ATP-binding protein AztA [Streptomyces sp. TRM 70351]